MNLEQLGWNPYWESMLQEALSAAAPPTERLTPEQILAGRVVSAHRQWLDVETAEGAVRVPDPVRLTGGIATVGDWLLLHRNVPRVLTVLPRQSQISRNAPGRRTEEQVLAANVDVAILVMGLDADFNVRRLERFLVIVAECGARALAVLNKADLCLDVAERVERVQSIAKGITVLSASALFDDVAAMLAPYLERGESAALLGSSGTGKSTMLNALLGEERQKTLPVREHDQRGRHTTTARELIVSPQGWVLFDLPGLREVQLWAGKESLDATFADIAELAMQCRFRDCRHQGEPGCAVAEGVAPERLRSFHRLEREIDSLEQRQGGLAGQNTKRRWKQIHKEMHKHPKYNR
ncbi:MAG: ribosome small subunit-dependent GTPase A [Bryobacterales bacterium]|nr:ribosome small subunit-dependent GTPase A [Bryobacterales bacterium]